MNENRYSRQLALPQVGSSGQARLARTKVLIVGAGGLGVPALSYLVGAGIGYLRLVDDDLIAEHNLHRQVLYTEAEQGQYKVEVAARKMRALNSQVTIEPITQRLVSSNVEALLSGCSMVIDAADNFTTTYLLSDSCQQSNKALISASASGMKGYIGVFCQGAPSYRALFPNPPDVGLSCASDGVLGPVVAVLGALQAQAAIKLALGEPVSNKLLNIDLWSGHFSSFDFSSAPEPGAEKSISILYHGEISAHDSLVDVREGNELSAPTLPGAQHIPLGEIAQRSDEIARHQRVVLCCTSGRRARTAAQILARKNYQNLAILSLG